jgi:hypothetical protein
MSETKPESLCYSFSSIQKRIITPVNIFNTLINKPKSSIEKALWDTGATISAITPKLVKELNFIPAGTMAISGITGSLDVEFVLTTIQLPAGILRKNIKMAVCDFSQDINIILGMDIITLGDFELLHGSNKTIFSFSSPPSAKIKLM